MFVQALHDMRIGHYPCTQMDLITLLALSTKAYFGDKELTDEELEKLHHSAAALKAVIAQIALTMPETKA